MGSKMKYPKDLTGERFGRLTVVGELERGKYETTKFICICDCGNGVNVRRSNLLTGTSKSCGCLRLKLDGMETKRGRKKVRSEQENRIYNIWNNMRYRCYNEKSGSFLEYGDKGITVCDEWNDSNQGFMIFYQWAINNGYEDKLTIDRIDPKGNYEPNNCKWSTAKEQANNRSNNIIVEVEGVTYSSISELARAYDEKVKRVYDRYRAGKRGMDLVTSPYKRIKNNT